MAWITKNSSAPAERSSTPILTAELAAHLEAQVIPRYPTRRAATLPALHAVQHEHGWLPPQAIEEVAGFLGLAPAEVLDTASFYEEFWLKPKGRYVIWVCQSISCELLGHLEVIERCRDVLGIDVGQTTDDGKFTLMSVECLGACGYGPCALVNETLHEHLTADALESVIRALE
jgi:NADH-quinone oxidoreductase subunit E